MKWCPAFCCLAKIWPQQELVNMNQSDRTAASINRNHHCPLTNQSRTYSVPRLLFFSSKFLLQHMALQIEAHLLLLGWYQMALYRGRISCRCGQPWSKARHTCCLHTSRPETHRRKTHFQTHWTCEGKTVLRLWGKHEWGGRVDGGQEEGWQGWTFFYRISGHFPLFKPTQLHLIPQHIHSVQAGLEFIENGH